MPIAVLTRNIGDAIAVYPADINAPEKTTVVPDWDWCEIAEGEALGVWGLGFLSLGITPYLKNW